MGLPDLGIAVYWKILLLRFEKKISAEYVIVMVMIRHFGKPNRYPDYIASALGCAF